MNGAASTQTDHSSTQVLKRERNDLSQELQRLGPLPVPLLDPPYSFRAAASDDAEMVSEWMNRPHLAETWEYAWPASRWRQHLDAQLEGTYSLPLIGTLRGEECAYLEIYWAAKDMISRHYDAQTPRHRATCGHRGPGAGQPGLRTTSTAANRDQRVRSGTTLRPDHVRPRPPQHHCPPTVRVRRMPFAWRARRAKPADGALRVGTSHPVLVALVVGFHSGRHQFPEDFVGAAPTRAMRVAPHQVSSEQRRCCHWSPKARGTVEGCPARPIGGAITGPH